MLRNKSISAILAVLAVLTLATPVSVFAVDPNLLLGASGGNNGNRHNFSRLSTKPSGPKAVDSGDDYSTRICIYCHTPHGGAPQSPLWNRLDPASMGSFQLFGSALGLAIVDDPAAKAAAEYGTDADGYPNGATKLCLSCHDGATAIGQMANGRAIALSSTHMDYAGSDTFTFNPATQSAKIANSHPVSFKYDLTVASLINTYHGYLAGNTGYIPPADPANWLDSKNRVQCTTCHNPHQDTRLDTVNGYTLPFWRNYTGDDAADYDNTCIVCHIGPTLQNFGAPPTHP